MHPVMAFGIRRHSAPSNMHRDCHTLFRALAASMTHDNDLLVEERRWVNNNAINELRDAAANCLLLQAYKFEDRLQQTHLIQLSFASRTYVNFGTPSSLSLGSSFNVLALADFIKRPIVILHSVSEDTYKVLWQTKRTESNDNPVYLIASATPCQHHAQMFIYYYGLAEKKDIDQDQKPAKSAIQEKWTQQQNLRNCILLSFRTLYTPSALRFSFETRELTHLASFKQIEDALKLIYVVEREREVY